MGKEKTGAFCLPQGLNVWVYLKVVGPQVGETYSSNKEQLGHFEALTAIRIGGVSCEHECEPLGRAGWRSPLSAEMVSFRPMVGQEGGKGSCAIVQPLCEVRKKEIPKSVKQ